MLAIAILLSGGIGRSSAAQSTRLSSDPDSVRFVTTDVALFWAAVSQAAPDSLESVLQREYLNRSTVAVADFTPYRIQSARHLASVFTAQRAKYDSSRAASAAITAATPAMRAAFRKLKLLYPDALFPDVYFVVGAMNTGGTDSNHGLIIGAEMYTSTERLPAIVSHELIHFQQHYRGRTLLQHAFLEGTADFLGNMISDQQLNGAAQAYGRAHEHELWRELTKQANDTTYGQWMYAQPTNGRPADLAYFIGYRIAEAYYNRAPDKRDAIRDLIAPSPFADILKESGYNP